MNRLSLPLGMLALTASLAACAGSKANNDAKGTSPTPTPTVAAKVFTEAQAKSALLVASDVPSGYQVDSEYTHDDLPGGCPAYDAAVAAQTSAAPTWVVASYGKGDTDFSVDEEIAVFTDAAEAAATLQTLTSAYATCGEWKVSAGGLTGTIKITPSSAPSLGEGAQKYLFEGAAGGDSFKGEQYVVQVGNALVYVDEGGGSDFHDDPALDLPGLTATLAARLNQQA
ncbi:MAG: hypothetical protein QOE64_478 [Frankiales bacterium]|nr:hypothetical protein [Frankiales bacterium]